MLEWESYRPTEADVRRDFAGTGNIGLLLGEPSDNLHDVDCDTVEAIRAAARILPPTNMLHGRPGRPMAHWWFRSTTGSTPVARYKDPVPVDGGDGRKTCVTIVELRGTGGQTVIPPSVHPSGAQLAWVKEGGPAEVPLALLQAAVRRIAACALVARHYPEKGRHDLTLALAGFLLRRGMSEPDVESFLLTVAHAAGPDAERPEDIRHIKTNVSSTASKLRAGRRATGGRALRELLDSRVIDRLTEWLEQSDETPLGGHDDSRDSGGIGDGSAGDDTEIPPVPLLVDLPTAVELNLPRAPVPFGIDPLDAVLGGGIDRDEAVAIGGAPGTFKTSLLCYAVPSLATSTTAVLFVAADEPSNRIARKIGSRYGERWSELCSDYPPVIARLRETLDKRSAFIRVTHPRASYTLEDALEAFDREAPRERHRIVLLDHLQAVVPRCSGDDDTEKAAIERVVSVLIDGYVRSKAWSLVALSEITKAALSPEAVQEAPMSAFAGTRKIVSRFDAALVMTSEGDRRVRVLPAKNRFGPKTPFSLEWDTQRWTLTHIEDQDIEAERGAALAERQARVEAQEDAAVLEVVRRARTPIKRSELPDRVKLRAAHVRAALARLVDAGVLRLEQGPAGGSGGVRPVLVVEVRS